MSLTAWVVGLTSISCWIATLVPYSIRFCCGAMGGLVVLFPAVICGCVVFDVVVLVVWFAVAGCDGIVIGAVGLDGKFGWSNSIALL